MDWTLALDRNKRVLLRLVMGMMALAGRSEGQPVARVSRTTSLRILRLLRPAESALRRLILIAEYVLDIPETEPTGTRTRAKSAAKAKSSDASGKRAPAFGLLDPRKPVGPPKRQRRPKGPGPRMWCFDGTDPAFDDGAVDAPSETVDAVRLCRRLLAMLHALEDLPKQVRRLRRLRARRKAAGNPISHPMRRGRPPGYRARNRHFVDVILKECQQLALRAANKPPDTS